MKRLRRWLGQKLWDLGNWIYAYHEFPEKGDADRQRVHEISFTVWGCSDREAEGVFTRMSDAICGVEHHPIECPGPGHAGSMTSTDMNPCRIWTNVKQKGRHGR